jgi:hypothetical protein
MAIPVSEVMRSVTQETLMRERFSVDQIGVFPRGGRLGYSLVLEHAGPFTVEEQEDAVMNGDQLKQILPYVP